MLVWTIFSDGEVQHFIIVVPSSVLGLQMIIVRGNKENVKNAVKQCTKTSISLFRMTVQTKSCCGIMVPHDMKWVYMCASQEMQRLSKVEMKD